MFEISHQVSSRRRVDTGRESLQPPGPNALRPAQLALPAVQRSVHPPFDLITVYDAAEFIVRLEPERQAQPWWERCGLALVRASISGRRRDVERAAELLEQALRRENRLGPAPEAPGRERASCVSPPRRRSVHRRRN